MAEVACDMANLDRHLARHLGHLFCDLLVDWGGSSRNLDETQATPRFCSPIVRFCIQLRKPVKNRKSKPVKKSCTCERTRPLTLYDGWYLFGNTDTNKQVNLGASYFCVPLLVQKYQSSIDCTIMYLDFP